MFRAKLVRRTLAATGVAVVAVAIGLSSSWLVDRRQGSVDAQPGVDFQERIVVRPGSDGRDAALQASSKLGFEVRLPGAMPDDLALNAIEIDVGTVGAKDPTKTAMLFFGRQSGSGKSSINAVLVTEVAVRTEVPANYESDPAKNTNVRVPLDRDGVEVWQSGVLPRTAYTVWSINRTFFVVVDGERPLSTAELASMVDGFVPR